MRVRPTALPVVTSPGGSIFQTSFRLFGLTAPRGTGADFRSRHASRTNFHKLASSPIRPSIFNIKIFFTIFVIFWIDLKITICVSYSITERNNGAKAMMDQEIFFVKADHGKLGQEAIIDFNACAKADVIADLISDEHEAVAAVLYMNVAEGVSRDVTEDIARECFTKQLGQVESADDFCEFVKAQIPDYEEEWDLATREPAYDRLGSFEYGLEAAE